MHIIVQTPSSDASTLEVDTTDAHDVVSLLIMAKVGVVQCRQQLIYPRDPDAIRFWISDTNLALLQLVAVLYVVSTAPPPRC